MECRRCRRAGILAIAAEDAFACQNITEAVIDSYPRTVAFATRLPARAAVPEAGRSADKVSQLHKPGRGHEAAPRLPVVESTVAATVPSLLAVAARIRAEQDATGFSVAMQFQQDAGQRFAGHMKQRRVGEHAIELAGRQRQIEEVLLEHGAAAVCPRHLGQLR